MILQIKNLAKSSLSPFAVTFVIYILFYMQIASANSLDASTMLENFSQTVRQFMQLVTATAYVMGMFFIYKGSPH